VKPYFRELTVKDLVASISAMDASTATIVRSLATAGGFFDTSVIGNALNAIKRVGVGCITGALSSAGGENAEAAGVPSYLGSTLSRSFGASGGSCLGAGARRQRMD
jgi:hypothetical protein